MPNLTAMDRDNSKAIARIQRSIMLIMLSLEHSVEDARVFVQSARQMVMDSTGKNNVENPYLSTRAAFIISQNLTKSAILKIPGIGPSSWQAINKWVSSRGYVVIDDTTRRSESTTIEKRISASIKFLVSQGYSVTKN